jgi:hypothetical protein
MGADRGQLSRLAIAAIFIVVIGTMHVAVQYSRGEILHRESPTDLETDLRAAIWNRLDAERVERGFEPAARETTVRVPATETARTLLERDYYGTRSAVGVRETEEPLPNRQPLCSQVPVKYTVSRPGWNATGDRGVPDAVVADVADELVRQFGRAAVDVTAIRNDHRHGIGIAVDGNVVYAVYRYCNLGY